MLSGCDLTWPLLNLAPEPAASLTSAPMGRLLWGLAFKHWPQNRNCTQISSCSLYLLYTPAWQDTWCSCHCVEHHRQQSVCVCVWRLTNNAQCVSVWSITGNSKCVYSIKGEQSKLCVEHHRRQSKCVCEVLMSNSYPAGFIKHNSQSPRPIVSEISAPKLVITMHPTFWGDYVMQRVYQRIKTTVSSTYFAAASVMKFKSAKILVSSTNVPHANLLQIKLCVTIST